MDVEIRFSNILAERIGTVQTVKFPNQEKISVTDFLKHIADESWSSEVLEDGYIKNPVILIIDNDLIQVSNGNNSDKFITKDSSITFQIMFAGG